MAAKKTETTEAVVAEETVKIIKAKVVRPFKDKETGVLHKAGDVIEVTEERYKEILKVGKLIRKA